MAWIESHQELGQHPKTRKLAHLLGVSKPAAVGHLQYLWWWAMDYADDGDLSRFDDLDIAIGSEWEGDESAFVDALVSAGFIDRGPDGTHRIHDWDQYGGKLADRRKANAERMRRARAERDAGTDKARAAHVQRTQRARVGLEESREEESREEESDIDGADAPSTPSRKRATQVPEDFAITDALEAWGTEHGFSRAQMEAEVPAFVDHYLSKGEARKDWTRSFHNWMRKAIEYGRIYPALTVHRGGQSAPPGVELLPGEVVKQIAPDHWELFNPADGRKRIIRPDFYGVIFDERKHLHDGYASFVRERQEAERRAHAQEQIA